MKSATELSGVKPSLQLAGYCLGLVGLAEPTLDLYHGKQPFQRMVD